MGWTRLPPPWSVLALRLVAVVHVEPGFRYRRLVASDLPSGKAHTSLQGSSLYLLVSGFILMANDISGMVAANQNS